MTLPTSILRRFGHGGRNRDGFGQRRCASTARLWGRSGRKTARAGRRLLRIAARDWIASLRRDPQLLTHLHPGTFESSEPRLPALTQLTCRARGPSPTTPDLLGHKTLAMTEYAHVTATHTGEAVQKREPAIGAPVR